MTKEWLSTHLMAAKMDAFILTGTTLRVILDKTKTSTKWLATELDASENVILDLLSLGDKPLSKIFTISILCVLPDRFGDRGKIKSIQEFDVPGNRV